jgi:hypothetical protein
MKIGIARRVSAVIAQVWVMSNSQTTPTRMSSTTPGL